MATLWPTRPSGPELVKIKSGTSPITHHTSHITYYIGIFKFYKILVIKPVVTFNNSSKLILKKFDKYFLMEIITLTIQTHMSCLKLVKTTISRWNKALSEKLGLTQKSWKNLWHYFFSSKVIKKNWVIKNPKTSRSAFFKMLSVMLSDFLKFFNRFWRKKTRHIFSKIDKFITWMIFNRL